MTRSVNSAFGSVLQFASSLHVVSATNGPRYEYPPEMRVLLRAHQWLKPLPAPLVCKHHTRDFSALTWICAGEQGYVALGHFYD
jgi:hypothetical protein